MKVLLYSKHFDYKVVRASEGNRGPITTFFAKHFDMPIRSELGEANRYDPFYYNTFLCSGAAIKYRKI